MPVKAENDANNSDGQKAEDSLFCMRTWIETFLQLLLSETQHRRQAKALDLALLTALSRTFGSPDFESLSRIAVPIARTV